MKPTEEQQRAIDLIKSGKNVFLTGSGGVGKSYVIQEISDHSTLICAPTGIAALNVQGSTCHSLFQMPIGLIRRKDEVNINASLRRRFDYNSGVNRIVIDEVSMLRADYLDLINKKLQKIRGSEEPFGGIQIVVVGDFFQLPPIVGEAEEEHFYEKYKTPFAFGASCWDFEMIELKQVIRQSDEEQIAILNAIRKNQNIGDSLARLKEMSSQKASQDVLRLCCFNKDAQVINHQEYKKIDAKESIYHARFSAKWGKEEPSPKTLRVKQGMKVIMTMNLPGKYTNGEKGFIEGVDESGVTVKLERGVSVLVEEATWEKYTYTKKNGCVEKTPSACYTQLPIKYGYAVSIHKSQGMTLDNVAIDVGRGCFSHGQLYVALSRCKDLRNITFLQPITEDDIILEEEVRQFYNQ